MINQVLPADASPAACEASRAGSTVEGSMREQLLHVDGHHDMHLHPHLATNC